MVQHQERETLLLTSCGGHFRHYLRFILPPCLIINCRVCTCAHNYFLINCTINYYYRLLNTMSELAHLGLQYKGGIFYFWNQKYPLFLTVNLQYDSLCSYTCFWQCTFICILWRKAKWQLPFNHSLLAYLPGWGRLSQPTLFAHVLMKLIMLL